MSRYYGSYSQYLGAQKCCDTRGPGPQGPVGPTGPSAIGQIGYTGPAGASFTGPTGRSCRGPTGEPGPTGPKSFIIQHPVDKNKYLVHACLEGPEAGVYYRGKGEIIDDFSTTIELPNYVDKFSSEFSVQITPIFNGKLILLNTSEVLDNKFTVYGENSKFYWQVTGKRMDFNVEPLKSDVNVKGDGPYLYI